MSASASAAAIDAAKDVILDLPSMESSALEAALRLLADDKELKAGQLFGILRIAVTGQRVSPPLIESMEIIGKDEVIRRISSAIDKLSKLEIED